jgi:hypothetical protein
VQQEVPAAFHKQTEIAGIYLVAHGFLLILWV